MLAEIITIGDEILIGQIVDTNSAWLGAKLNAAGVRIKQITSVSDDRSHILEALHAAAARVKLVIITGGLGPTKDDITKKTLADYFGVGFKRDAATEANVRAIFVRIGRPLLDINLQQADVPENCVALLNKNGTAPGMWFDEKGVIYVSLPGVPHEMMALMDDAVLPRLIGRGDLQQIIHHTLLTSGIGESFLADKISDIEDALPPSVKLAYLPKLGQVRLRLSGYGPDRVVLQQEIDAAARKIRERVAEHLVGEGDLPIGKVVLNLLEQSGATLTVAESCTGGYLSHLLTQHPGSSRVFLGGAVTYSNALKTTLLGVKPETLDAFGAVSGETAREMAEGALTRFGSTYAVAITGIAGPGGETPGKPVGTVWVAVASAKHTETRRFSFGSRREQNIERAAVSALTELLKLIREEPP